MKPDWDKLGSQYEDSKYVVIADVDCTANENKNLCSENGVRGYPTIKYFMGGSPEDYKGGRSFSDLQSFVDENLSSPPCDNSNRGECSAEQLEKLDAAVALSQEDRDAAIEEKVAAVKESEDGVQDLLQKLQKQYQDAMTESEELVKKLKGELKWLRAANKGGAEEKEEL